MTKTKILTAALVLATALAGSLPALAQDATPHAQQEFVGVDLDNGSVYYNGRNSGRYCLYRTVERYNRQSGYVEDRRVRTCGKGLYLD